MSTFITQLNDINCKFTAMLDIIENDLLKKHLPNVSYLRLDGSIPTNQRHDIVSKFNNDPSIDILLLTTQVILSYFNSSTVAK